MTNPSLMVTAHGGPDVLSVRDLPIPQAGPGEVVVRVEAAGINFIDVYQRQGVYPSEPPFVVGREGAGTVVALGGGVTSPDVGDRVAWPFALASAARYAVVPVSACVPVPAQISTEDAAAVMLQGLTAHYLIHSTYAIQPGDRALVHAAAGGVGQLLVQWITALGGVVIATAGSAEKCAAALALGASSAINYATESDLVGAIAQATSGEGVAVAYDGVGKDTFDVSLASLRRRGMLVLFGGASGQVPPVDLQRLNAAGSVFVTRPSLPDYLAAEGELQERADDLFAALASGAMKVTIGGRYPLAEASAAYQALEARASQGKLILQP